MKRIQVSAALAALITLIFSAAAMAEKAADLERLEAMDNVSSVRLDVTLQDDIDAAVKFVHKQGRGLYGLVNNAGVGSFSSLATGPESDIDFTFNVNVYGPYRVNKAFLPLLDASDGRTTIIGSIAGFIAGRSGIYSMSKFAVEAYTDSLAREMADTGVHVSIQIQLRHHACCSRACSGRKTRDRTDRQGTRAVRKYCNAERDA
jgi:NAD(P)-dependent dehydrogenase (short-subunit alcohol dehydrogenase family)